MSANVPLLSTRVFARCAKFDQNLDAISHATARLHYKLNYHHLLRETWPVSSPFITTVSGTDSASPGDIHV